MIKKDIFNKDIKEQFKAAAEDKLYRFILADKMIKGAIVKTTRMVNEMRANHDLGSLETLVLGQGYIAAALLCSSLKGKDRVNLNIQCSGPVKGIDVESNIYGEVRGFLKNNPIPLGNMKNVKSLSPIFGAGFLTVTKYLEEAPKPYSGQVAMEYGSIAEDLANYFLKSEQIPTGFNLSIFFDDQDEVKGAGGILLQAMPGAKEDQVIEAEKIMQGINSFGEQLSNGVNPKDIISQNFTTLEPQFLSSSRVEFFCRCSKDKMNNYLSKLPLDDIQEILENGPFPVQINCHHCNSLYEFSKNELKTIYSQRK